MFVIRTLLFETLGLAPKNRKHDYFFWSDRYVKYNNNTNETIAHNNSNTCSQIRVRSHKLLIPRKCNVQYRKLTVTPVTVDKVKKTHDTFKYPLIM